MPEIIGSPSRYVQGPRLIGALPEHVSAYGTKALVIASAHIYGLVEDTLEKAFRESACSYETAVFSGECCRSEIEALREKVRQTGSDVIVGIGGGKAIDTAKAVSCFEKLPVVVAPSAASSDAPCSSLAVLYTDDHVFESYLDMRRSPDCVIMDTQLLAEAPPRLLAAGMGDALATWFEARACARSGADNCLGGSSTATAQAISKLCYETLMTEGLKAILAAQEHTPTPAFERIVEANTYMSGIGFESGGLAAAHAIHNGLTELEGTHELLHGEKVAFGLIAMLVMEDVSEKKLQLVVSFCITMGLPVTFAQLGIPDVTSAELQKVAETAASPNSTAHNMPFKVTAEKVFNALVAADAVGRYLSGEDETAHAHDGSCCSRD